MAITFLIHGRHLRKIGNQITSSEQGLKTLLTRGRIFMAEIMTTKEVADYLKLHAITICKLCKERKIPAVRIGRVWRFDKKVIDKWIAGD